MHERESPAGNKVQDNKKTVWYGIGEALGPDAWRKRILHVIDTQIIPRSNPKWQEWAKKHREEIETVAARAGVNITVVEIALGSVAIITGAKHFRKTLEMNRMNKKLDTRWGMYPPSSLMELTNIPWYKKLPSELAFFQEQIYQNYADTIGIKTSRRLSEVVSVLADPKIARKQVNNWNNIIRLANSGSVALAVIVLEEVFTAGIRRASELHGWDKEIPDQYKKTYAKTLLSLWLELQVEEFAGRAVYNNDYSPQTIIDAFARIRDHQRSQPIVELVSPVPQDTRLRKNIRHIRTVLSRLRKKDVGLIGGIPISHIDATALDHIRSLSHATEASFIGNMQDAMDDTILSAKLHRKMENAGLSISDTLKKQFIAHKMSRAKDEREKVRAHKSAEPYFVLGHDFTKEEQMVADMNVPAKDYLGNPLTYPRNFFYHGDDIGSRTQELENLALGRSEDVKPEGYTRISSYDEVTSAEPEPVTKRSSTAPETFLERTQRKLLEAEHVRGTKNRLKRIEQARKEYAKKHPSKAAG
mgnify:FL=1